jgi:PAS domain S-box-containing protein
MLSSRTFLKAASFLAALLLPAAGAAGQQRLPVFPIERGVIDTGTQNTGAIIQDSDGFIWIGSIFNGLSRWDGYELMPFMPGGAGSISDTAIFALFEDRDGGLWVATGSGLDRYDKRTGLFTVYRHDPARSSSIGWDAWQFPSPQVFAQGRDGALWIGTRAGLDRMDARTGACEHYRADPADARSISSDNVRAVLVDAAGTLWAGTDAGLNRLDPASGGFTRWAEDRTLPDRLGCGRVTALCDDLQGGLWVGTENGLYRLDKKTGRFTRLLHDPADPGSPAADWYTSLTREGSGGIWLCYINARSAGVSLLDPATGSCANYRSDPADPRTLSADAVNGVLQDRTGTLWFVNDARLVDKHDPLRPPFTYYGADGGKAVSLPSPGALRIIQSRDSLIWIGTRPRGLSSFDKRTGKLTTRLADRYYPAVTEDAAGTLWISTTAPGTLHAYDPRAGRILRSWTNVPGDPSSLGATPQINDILQDARDPNILWLLLYGAGIDRFDKRAGTFTHFRHRDDSPQSLSKANALMFWQDPKGILWIPTQGAGLDRMDPDTGAVRHFTADPDGRAGPASSSATCIAPDPSGALWIGSVAGLDRMDPDTGVFTHYTRATGCPLPAVVTIGQDRTGVLWLGTSGGGLVRFSPAAGRVKTYTERDGIQSDAFFPWNALRDSDGELWFGGSKGVTRFKPWDIVANVAIPPVYVTALRQSGEPLAIGRAPEHTEAITLDWRSASFEFEYAALGYTEPDKNRYRYKLEGLDQDWFDAGARRFGRYSGLRPGAYTLRVTASNNDGIWNPDGASIRVTVTTPWWASWWFAASTAAAAAAVLFVVVWSIVSRRRTAAAAEQAVREGEERYRLLFESSPVGIAVTTREGRAVAWNSRMRELLGYEDTDTGLLSVSAVYRRPEDRGRILEAVRRDGAARDFETVLTRKDGSACHVSLTMVPFTLAGAPCLLAAVNDINARKAAEAERDGLWERIREQADRMQRILDAVPDGVFLIGADGRVTLANPAARRALADLAVGAAQPVSALGNRPLAELLEPPSQGSAHVVEAAGSPAKVFEIISRPIMTEPGASNWVLVVREVTQEREMQQRVRQQEKLAAVGQLTAGIAHDFNNLLTAINGFAELARAESVDEEGSAWMESILQSGQRAADLVRQLLVFSRRQVVEARVVSLNDSVIATGGMLQRIIGENVTLAPRLADGLWRTRVDPTQLEQVIVNLAVNARDAMPRGGLLTVETANVTLDRESALLHQVERAGDYVTLAVSDTGVGMSDEVKAHIFEPFFTTKEPGQGTGLGLATVFGIVKQAGGSITAYSEPGHGSVFRVYLPRVPEEGAAAEAASAQAVRVEHGSATILLVEDDPGVRALALHMLGRLGYAVIAASSPAEALAAADGHEGPIDLLLTDLVMPGMNGKELADQLSGRRPGLRVLFMSGYTDGVIDFNQLLNAGTSFLQKPFLTAELSRKVGETLRRPPPSRG